MAREKLAPLPYIYNALKEDKSASQGLREYREAGGSIRDSRWFRAWGEIYAEMRVRPDIQVADTKAIPSPNEITTQESNRPGGFIARGGVVVAIRTVDPLTGRTSEETRVNFGSVRMQNLRNFGEIMGELESKFGPEGQSGVERSTVIDSFITGIAELVPPEE